MQEGDFSVQRIASRGEGCKRLLFTTGHCFQQQRSGGKGGEKGVAFL